MSLNNEKAPFNSLSNISWDNVDHNKVKPSKLWQLVKRIEEESEILKKNDHSELVATLVVNFSDCNKGRNPVLISKEDKPLMMLIKVLEYYHCENDRLKIALKEATQVQGCDATAAKPEPQSPVPNP